MTAISLIPAKAGTQSFTLQPNEAAVVFAGALMRALGPGFRRDGRSSRNGDPFNPPDPSLTPHSAC